MNSGVILKLQGDIEIINLITSNTFGRELDKALWSSKFYYISIFLFYYTSLQSDTSCVYIKEQLQVVCY